MLESMEMQVSSHTAGVYCDGYEVSMMAESKEMQVSSHTTDVCCDEPGSVHDVRKYENASLIRKHICKGISGYALLKT